MTSLSTSALACMVCDITIGKEKWETGWEAAENTQQVAIPLFNTSLELAVEDSKSFDAVMEAYRLPKDSEESVMLRRNQIRLATLEGGFPSLRIYRKIFGPHGTMITVQKWLSIAAYDESRDKVRQTKAITDIFSRIYPILSTTHRTEIYEEVD